MNQNKHAVYQLVHIFVLSWLCSERYISFNVHTLVCDSCLQFENSVLAGLQVRLAQQPFATLQGQGKLTSLTMQ